MIKYEFQIPAFGCKCRSLVDMLRLEQGGSFIAVKISLMCCIKAELRGVCTPLCTTTSFNNYGTTEGELIQEVMLLIDGERY